MFGRSLILVMWALAGPAAADSYQEMQILRPDFFDPETGFRIAQHRAPVPLNIPSPVIAVEAPEAARLLDAGAIPIDVFGAAQSRFDELDGTWLVSKPRHSLPGATWLPETGRGVLDADMVEYLRSNMARVTSGDFDAPLLVFCIADCWISWNASQRIAGLGYTQVYWFRTGTDGWLDIGRELVIAEPVPVNVD